MILKIKLISPINVSISSYYIVVNYVGKVLYLHQLCKTMKLIKVIEMFLVMCAAVTKKGAVSYACRSFYFILLHLQQIYPNHHPVLCIMAPFSLAHIFTLLLLAAVAPLSTLCMLPSKHSARALPEATFSSSLTSPTNTTISPLINPLLQTQCFQSAVCRKTGPAHLPPQKDRTALC